MRQPKDVDAIHAAFPTSVDGFIPLYKDIPDALKDRDHWAVKLFSKLFFEGGDLSTLKEKPGVDRSKAIRHIKYVMKSWELKHEHKEAAVAYLFSEWFEQPVETNP